MMIDPTTSNLGTTRGFRSESESRADRRQSRLRRTRRRWGRAWLLAVCASHTTESCTARLPVSGPLPAETVTA